VKQPLVTHSPFCDRSARLSILFSIIRIDPSPGRRRRLLYIAGLFILVWAILMGQLFWICEPEPGWRDQASPQCRLNKQVAICQVVCPSFSFSIEYESLRYLIFPCFSGRHRGLNIDLRATEASQRVVRPNTSSPSHRHIFNLYRYDYRLPRPRCIHHHRRWCQSPHCSSGGGKRTLPFSKS